MVVALGADYWGINFMFQEPLADVEAKVEDRGAPAVVPDPAAALSPSSGSPDAAGDSAAGEQAPAGDDDRSASASVAADAAEADDEPVEAAAVISGRPPEGETCG